MCHFITLIASSDDDDAIRMVMQRHGRAANPMDNPSIRKVLHGDERQYATTPGHCDCGTVLASQPDSPQAFAEKLAAEASRLRRKGWSEAKIARLIKDRRKADARPRPNHGATDSLALWNAILCDLKELKLPHAGFLVRYYSGAVSSETFTASRRELSADCDWHQALASLAEDEVTIFQLN